MKSKVEYKDVLPKTKKPSSYYTERLDFECSESESYFEHLLAFLKVLETVLDIENTLIEEDLKN